MANSISYNADVVVNGHLSCRTFTPPAGCVTNASIVSGAKVAADKLVHQHALRYVQAGGSDVVSATVPIHTCRNTAEVIAVEVVPITAPSGGDKQYTVDVQAGNASSAFASILSAVVDVDAAGAADRTVQVGTISDDDLADGDTVQVVVTASGSTGSQGQGLIVTVWVREEP